MSVTLHDTGGRLYPTALKQLFSGVYVLELCLIGLFLSIRDDRNVPTGIGQAVIMTITGIATVAYQLLLRKTLNSTLTYLPASIDKESDKSVQFKSAHTLLDSLSSLYYLYKDWITDNRKGPSRSASTTLQESIHQLARSQLIGLKKHGYSNEAIHNNDDTVWIPKDHLGISEDEISNAEGLYPGIKITSQFAALDEKGTINVSLNAF